LILDTTVLISAERTRSRLDAVMADDDDVAIAAVTVAELLVGVELATSRHRARRATFVEGVLGTLVVEDYTADTARSHAALLVATRRDGRPRGAHDLIIAATAVSTGRILVTGDDRGFEALPGLEVRAIA
jgi:tRNA(fMet)-specific endonuclease VapC